MWDLFDFNSDGKTNLFEKVVGIEMLDSNSQDEDTPIDGNESDGELDEDEFDEQNDDDETLDDDDEDFYDEDEFRINHRFL